VKIYPGADAVLKEIFFPDGGPVQGTQARAQHCGELHVQGGNVQLRACSKRKAAQERLPSTRPTRLLLEALGASGPGFSREPLTCLEQFARERANSNTEMPVAAHIQQKIIPVTLPAIEGYDIGWNQHSLEIRGRRLLRLHQAADGRYAVVIADVAGREHRLRSW